MPKNGETPRSASDGSGTKDVNTPDAMWQPLPGLPLTPDQVRQFFTTMPFAVAVFDDELRYLIASRRWKKDYGLMGKDLIGMSQYDVFPNMTDEWRDRYKRCLGGEIFDSQISSFKKKDGSEEWIRWHLYPWKTEQRTIGGVLLFTDFITQQHEKEVEIERNSSFLQVVLESIQDGILASDPAGGLSLVNAAARQMLDWVDMDLDDYTPGDGYDLFKPDGKTPLAEEERPLARALRGEEIESDELVLKKEGKPDRRVIANGRPMSDSDNTNLGAVVSIHDITKETQITDELREREAQFRDLYNKTPAMLHSVDQNGRLLRVSDFWLEKLGYDREEVLGRPFSDFLPEESQTYVRDVVLPQFQKIGYLENVDFKVLTKDRNVIDVQLSATAEYDEAGKLTNSLTVLTDVTERRRMERAVRRSEAQFRSIFETSPQGMALVSPSGRWLMANKALCDVFGYEEKDLLEIGIRNLTHPDDLDTEIEQIRNLLDGERQSFQMEKRYLHSDGSTIWAQVSITLIRDENNEPIQFVFQLLDLTGRKQAEEQLLQAQKLETVGQLTGGLAHDFNNLLGVILLSFQLLERMHTDEQSLKRIKTGLDATNRGAELTRRLLAFSRRQALEQSVTDVTELIEGMSEMFERTLGGAIEVETYYADDLSQIEVDQHQLESGLLNLAINARDAMPDGGTIVIEANNVTLDEAYAHTHSEVEAGPYVQIAFTDTGEGMTEEVLAEVFQPFFTTKEVGKGTGLGLSMLYGFIKQSKGHIEIYSEVDVGTSVKLYLPALPAVGASEDAEVSENEIGIAGGRETILVVEDDDDVREVTVGLLESFGYSIVQAVNGLEASAILDSDVHIDLVFSDIVMPGGVDGIAVVNKAQNVRPDISVLLTTGFAEAATRSSLDNDIEVVSKPYRAEDLAGKIRALLDERH